jgi:hypothetical protein
MDMAAQVFFDDHDGEHLGSASFWYPGSASNKNQNPDPHQIKFRIRISIKVIAESGSASIFR